MPKLKFRKEKTLKSAIAYGICGVLIFGLLWLLSFIPLAVYMGILFLGKWFIIGIITAATAGGLMAVLVPSLVWVAKMIHWAIVYTFFFGGKELTFPPKWDFMKSWEWVSDYLGSICFVVVSVILVSVFIWGLTVSIFTTLISAFVLFLVFGALCDGCW